MRHQKLAVGKCLTLSLLLLLLLTGQSRAAESDYYQLTTIPIPEGVVLEVGAIDLLPNGQLAVSTRRGEIWLVDHPFGQPEAMKFHRFAHGLHEVLGLTHRDGWLYVTQRCDVSRLKDTNSDGVADVFEVVNADWDINGDYHEYAFGSDFDREGNLWVTLCLTGSFNSQGQYRGWCLRITPDGRSIPTCSGIRSPGGMGMNEVGDMFYTDNQGPWNGTCSLKFLRPGSFQGNPSGNQWYDLPEVREAMGARPRDPESGSRFMVEAAKIPEYEPPVILFPYKKMGQSASGIACDVSQGKFGPFQGQLFVGDQTNSTVMRCSLEKVEGHYQGACFPFREGFASGTLALRTTSQGAMFVGGTNRGWGSRGTQPFSLQRLDWTGKTPFEIHHMEAQPEGFRFHFTEPVDSRTAENLTSYQVAAYTYLFQSAYGSPEVDLETPTIKSAKVADDRRSVFVQLDSMKAGQIYEFLLTGVRSADGQPLLHTEAYYTLNRIPKK